MDWASDRVQQGGMFHPTTNKFSESTRDFIKVLNNETMMNTMFRDKRKYNLRSDSSDNGRSRLSLRRSEYPQSAEDLLKVSRTPPEITICPTMSKRRSLSCIEQSGAYEREQFRPKIGMQSRDEMKQRLQDRMAFGDEIKPPLRRLPQKVVVEEPELTVEEAKMKRYEELMQEIIEREEWLENMEAIGEATKHKSLIREQICEKFREIDSLKLQL